jgi:hypothetical protein
MTRLRPARLSLLLADVDDTLVAHGKVLNERAARAVRTLSKRGVRFATTSAPKSQRSGKNVLELTGAARSEKFLDALEGAWPAAEAAARAGRRYRCSQRARRELPPSSCSRRAIRSVLDWRAAC